VGVRGGDGLEVAGGGGEGVVGGGEGGGRPGPAPQLASSPLLSKYASPAAAPVIHG
jgi:hypothetical protein